MANVTDKSNKTDANDITQGLSLEARAVVEKTVKAGVESFEGIELVEIKYSKQYGKLNLSAYIWSSEGISLDDCEKVHNVISQSLDALEALFPAEYVLNVSSQGLDRKITSDDDFRRALGTEIEIMDSSKKKHKGVLSAWNEETATLANGDKVCSVLRKNIIKAQPLIKFD